MGARHHTRDQRGTVLQTRRRDSRCTCIVVRHQRRAVVNLRVVDLDLQVSLRDDLREVVGHRVVGDTVAGVECRRDGHRVGSRRSRRARVGVGGDILALTGHRTVEHRCIVLQAVHLEAVHLDIGVAQTVRTRAHEHQSVIHLRGVQRNGQRSRRDHLLEVVSDFVVRDTVAGREGIGNVSRIRIDRINVGSHTLGLALHRTLDDGGRILQARDREAVVLAVARIRQRAFEHQTVVHLRGVQLDGQRSRRDHLFEVVAHIVVVDTVIRMEFQRDVDGVVVIRSRRAHIMIGGDILALARHLTAQLRAVLQTGDGPRADSGSRVTRRALDSLRQLAHELLTVIHLRGVEGNIQVALRDDLREVVAHIVVGDTVAGGEVRRNGRGTRRAVTRVGSHIRVTACHRTGGNRCIVLQTVHRPFARGLLVGSIHVGDVGLAVGQMGCRDAAHHHRTVIHLRGVEGDSQVAFRDLLREVVNHTVVGDAVGGAERSGNRGGRCHRVVIHRHILRAARHRTGDDRRIVLQTAHRPGAARSVGFRHVHRRVGVARVGRNRAHELQTVIHLLRIEGNEEVALRDLLREVVVQTVVGDGIGSGEGRRDGHRVGSLRSRRAREGVGRDILALAGHRTGSNRRIVLQTAHRPSTRGSLVGGVHIRDGHRRVGVARVGRDNAHHRRTVIHLRGVEGDVEVARRDLLREVVMHRVVFDRVAGLEQSCVSNARHISVRS